MQTRVVNLLGRFVGIEGELHRQGYQMICVMVGKVAEFTPLYLRWRYCGIAPLAQPSEQI